MAEKVDAPVLVSMKCIWLESSTYGIQRRNLLYLLFATLKLSV